MGYRACTSRATDGAKSNKGSLPARERGTPDPGTAMCQWWASVWTADITAFETRLGALRTQKGYW